MGVSFCTDKNTPRSERPSFKYNVDPHSIVHKPQDTEAPIPISDEGPEPYVSDQVPEPNVSDEVPEQNISDEGPASYLTEEEKVPTPNGKGRRLSEDVFKISIIPPEDNYKASTYTKSRGIFMHDRNISEPLPGLHIEYSSVATTQEQTIFVDEALVEALAKPQSEALEVPTTTRFSLSRRSMSAIQKKGHINEDVNIHQITCADAGKSQIKLEVYKSVIALKEIWEKLDLDKDNHLNMAELTRFCKRIWEEPVEDGGAGSIMVVYAKVNPKKGMIFDEWCMLIKGEDPDLQEFVEDIYEIFVDPINSTIISPSESATSLVARDQSSTSLLARDTRRGS